MAYREELPAAPGLPRVVVFVSGGLVQDVRVPAGVVVEVRNYDVYEVRDPCPVCKGDQPFVAECDHCEATGDDPAEYDRDPETGDECSISEWGPNQ